MQRSERQDLHTSLLTKYTLHELLTGSRAIIEDTELSFVVVNCSVICCARNATSVEKIWT